jgi:hypothetical protein
MLRFYRHKTWANMTKTELQTAVATATNTQQKIKIPAKTVKFRVVKAVKDAALGI